MTEVYITRTASFLPNEKIDNDEMEDYVGLINGQKSKSKAIVLRNNRIKGRYYAITKDGKSTHTNAEMTALAVKGLFDNNPSEIEQVDLLCCGTSSPDQMMPSHAVMVHGHLPQMKAIEVISNAGVCCSGMHSLKYAFQAIKSGEKHKAIATGSDRLAIHLRSENFVEEVKKLEALEQQAYLAFDKDFLRWMLSDGAASFLIEDKPSDAGISLKIEWLEGRSYANSMEPCMYMGATKNEDGSLTSYADQSFEEIEENSTMSIKQDVKLLSANIVKLGFDHLKDIMAEKSFDLDEVDHFLPHLSSFFFKEKIAEILEENGCPIPEEKWFTNLEYKGNVGAGSIYLMVDELFNSDKLKKGEKILLMVPESSRFSYMYCLLTVC